MPNPIHGHALIQQSGEAIESISTSCGNTIAKMTKDCGRVVAKWGEVIQKRFDDDKLREKPWNTSLWACFDPIDLCLLTTFCPCITCGKTYHRLHNDGDMRDWEVVNVACAAYGTALCYSIGCVIPPCLTWQTGRVRALGDIKGHCLIDWLKSWVCTCCVVIQNEKESKFLYEKRAGLRGGGGFVDQQYTGSAGAGQEMVMPGPVEFGGVMHEHGVTGQTENSPANAQQTVMPEPNTQELGIERRDHAPSYLDGSFDGADEQGDTPKPNNNSSGITPTGTSSNTISGLGSWSPKSRAAKALRRDPPVPLTEPRSVARSRGWMLRIPDSGPADSPLEHEWFAQTWGFDEQATTHESSVQDRTITESSPHPQQTDGAAQQTTTPNASPQGEDATQPTRTEQYTDRPAEQTAHSASEYSQTQDITDPTEASSLNIGRIEPTFIHEPPTDAQVSSPMTQQRDGHIAIPEPAKDADTPSPIKTSQQAVERLAVLESLVQDMVMLDQGSLDRLHLRSEWRWLRGGDSQTQGQVKAQEGVEG